MKKMILVAMAAYMAIICLNAQEITKIGHATLRWSGAPGDEPVFYDQGTSRAFNICWFSFNYPSTSGDGQPVTLSALACMPDGGGDEAEINNVIAGCHITIAANKDCPTEYNTSGDMFSDIFLTMSLASSNLGTQKDLAYHNLVILPDYEGYGITKDRVHPYLCSEITARQVTDAVRYGIQLYQNDIQLENIRLPFRQDWRTICTGYSQGGAVALATQRFIEEQGLSSELHLAGSLCGDGPYSPLVTILDYMEQDKEGKEISIPVVIPLMLKGMCDYDEELANHQVSDFLNERFLETGVLNWIASKDMTIDDIISAWRYFYKNGKDGDSTYYKSVLTSSGKVILRNILKPELYDYFSELLDKYPDYSTRNIPMPEGGTPAKDLHRALENNNLTTGWIPTHPVCLYHSTHDEVVPFQNYQIAESNFGEQVTLYPSLLNGKHVDTGMEFFVSNQRFDAIRFLASVDNNSSGIISIALPPTTTQKWYDLYGRPIMGEPTSKGIYITGGRKILR